MDWEGKITENQDRIQVMLENVQLYQSGVSSSMINSIETNVIDNIIEVRKPVLHHNENDTPCMVQFQSDVML